jgi:hypothetical protein
MGDHHSIAGALYHFGARIPAKLSDRKAKVLKGMCPASSRATGDEDSTVQFWIV